jgi:serralysin
MRKFLVSLLSVGAVAAVAATPAMAGERESKTIVEKVVHISGASGFDTNSGDFDILREAVVATNLAGKLDGKGQRTVFAPTDQAFLDLTGAATEQEAFNGVAALGLPAVTQVLKYHLAPGRRAATQVVAATRVNTLLRGSFLTKARGTATLTDATGRTVGIAAPNAAKLSNGIIHAIDGVLLPFRL